jgi:hypothetical protein
MRIGNKWYPDPGAKQNDLANLSNLIQQMIYLGYQKKEDDYDNTYKIMKDNINREYQSLENLRTTFIDNKIKLPEYDKSSGTNFQDLQNLAILPKEERIKKLSEFGERITKEKNILSSSYNSLISGMELMQNLQSQTIEQDVYDEAIKGNVPVGTPLTAIRGSGRPTFTEGQPAGTYQFDPSTAWRDEIIEGSFPGTVDYSDFNKDGIIDDKDISDQFTGEWKILYDEGYLDEETIKNFSNEYFRAGILDGTTSRETANKRALTRIATEKENQDLLRVNNDIDRGNKKSAFAALDEIGNSIDGGITDVSAIIEPMLRIPMTDESGMTGMNAFPLLKNLLATTGDGSQFGNAMKNIDEGSLLYPIKDDLNTYINQYIMGYGNPEINENLGLTTLVSTFYDEKLQLESILDTYKNRFSGDADKALKYLNDPQNSGDVAVHHWQYLGARNRAFADPNNGLGLNNIDKADLERVWELTQSYPKIESARLRLADETLSLENLGIDIKKIGDPVPIEVLGPDGTMIPNPVRQPGRWSQADPIEESVAARLSYLDVLGGLDTQLSTDNYTENMYRQLFSEGQGLDANQFYLMQGLDLASPNIDNKLLLEQAQLDLDRGYRSTHPLLVEQYNLIDTSGEMENLQQSLYSGPLSYYGSAKLGVGGGGPAMVDWLTNQFNQPSPAVESFQPSADPANQLSTVQDVNQDGVIDVLDMIMSQMNNN